MGSKNTYVRGLFLVCLVTGPAVMACEAALDFDRTKIQHYASSDGAPPPSTDDGGGGGGDDAGDDSGPTPPPDAGQDSGPTDAGKDADTGT